jgi:hypothetical protein
MIVSLSLPEESAFGLFRLVRTNLKTKYTPVFALVVRKTFEVMRDEDRLLKRQTQGDDVDIDALVETLAMPMVSHACCKLGK